MLILRLVISSIFDLDLNGNSIPLDDGVVQLVAAVPNFIYLLQNR